jgi:diaminohydroxyphosphoribosylaminopyrimidine deaminase / 5-amino-6-(5-phosphoribosylamino)uracil reductase
MARIKQVEAKFGLLPLQEVHSLMNSSVQLSPAQAALARIERRTGPRPFIVAQLGLSLDGRIATQSGDSRGLGGAPSLDHLHRLRAAVDGVLVGIGTVRADNPQLNVRLCAGASPARIVLDARGALGAQTRCLAGDDGARRIVVRGAGVAGMTLPEGVEVLELPAPQGRFDLEAVMQALSRLGMRSLLIEGGACIISRALDLGLVDRLHLMISPVILGSGRAGLDLAPIDLISQARRPRTELIPLGEGDVLFDCDMTTAT